MLFLLNSGKNRGVLGEHGRLSGHGARQPEASCRPRDLRLHPCQTPSICTHPGGRKEERGCYGGASSLPPGAAGWRRGAAPVPHGAVHRRLPPVSQPLPPALQEPLPAGLPLHLQQDPPGEWAAGPRGAGEVCSSHRLQASSRTDSRTDTLQLLKVLGCSLWV